MTRVKLSLIILTVVFLLGVIPVAVLAQEEVPPPYAGLKNPFPWSDAAAQEAGKGIYRQSCLGCHGIKGDNLASFDFSTADYAQSLEGRPDFSFWALSEGRLDKGMPPYKSALSEEQRWQLLTYIWSLGAAASPEVTPPPPPLPPVEGGTLQLTIPGQAQTGQPLTIRTQLRDEHGKGVIAGALVKFFIRVDFFTSGLMGIGEAVTNDQGVAILEYTPRLTGDVQVVARYEAIETAAALTLTEAAAPFYQAEAGLRLPAPGEEVFIGPQSARELGPVGQAPTSAFRLPGGILSWLLLVVAAVILIWFTYFRVLYQVYRIPIVSEIRDIDTRLVPLVGLGIMIALGTLLALMLITGPYSHFHLVR